MKDICTAYSDGHSLTLCDSEGNSITTPLNLGRCIKDVKYEFGSLVFIDQGNQEIRINIEALVGDNFYRIINNLCWNGNSSAPIDSSGDHNSTNTILARIISKVLGEFLQTSDGVRAIEKELNNYFNGTSKIT